MGNEDVSIIISQDVVHEDFVFFTVLGLYLFGGESDPVIASAIGVSNLCENEFQRLQGWTKANNEAFLSAQNLFTDWENRTKKGTELAVIFKAFSDKLNENKDWATGQSTHLQF